MKEIINIKNELEDISIKIGQVKSVSLALEDGLINSNGKEFAPAMMLITNLLEGHEERLRKLIEFI